LVWWWVVGGFKIVLILLFGVFGIGVGVCFWGGGGFFFFLFGGFCVFFTDAIEALNMFIHLFL
jgi:hypothetical protein